jgi:hypothetical protein
VEGVAWDCRTTPCPLNYLLGDAVRKTDPPISTPNRQPLSGLAKVAVMQTPWVCIAPDCFSSASRDASPRDASVRGIRLDNGKVASPIGEKTLEKSPQCSV